MTRLLCFAIAAVLGALASVAGVVSGEIPAFPSHRMLSRDRQPLLFWVLIAALIGVTASITWMAIAAFSSAAADHVGGAGYTDSA